MPILLRVTEPVLGRIAALMLAEIGETTVDDQDGMSSHPGAEVLFAHVDAPSGGLSPDALSEALAALEGPSGGRRRVVSTSLVTDALAAWAAERGGWLLEVPWSFDTLSAALSGVRSGAAQPVGRWRHRDLGRFGALADLLGGDQIAVLVSTWMESNADLLARIADALAAGDRMAVTRAAHAIKGSAGSFDAPEVGETAARLERRAMDGPSSPLEGLSELLALQLREAEARMARLGGRSGG